MEVVGSIAGPLIGGLLQSDSAGDAADAQRSAARDTNALQKQMFDTVNNQEAPTRALGYGAMNQLATLLGIKPVASTGAAPGLESDPYSAQFGSLLKPFQAGDLASDPGYQFRLAEGMKSVNNNAGLRGGLYSGGALKALQQYGQGMASQEFGNAFNRDAATKDRFVNYLTSAAGMGSNAAGRTQAAGQNYANAVGNNIIGMGNVNAASTIGRGNVWSDTVNNVFAQGQRNDWWRTPRTASFGSQLDPFFGGVGGSGD